MRSLSERMNPEKSADLSYCSSMKTLRVGSKKVMLQLAKTTSMKGRKIWRFMIDFKNEIWFVDFNSDSIWSIWSFGNSRLSIFSSRSFSLTVSAGSSDFLKSDLIDL